ncbi:MAG: substrate-binding domain-containing protein [Lentisphaerae bacterium]|nr:substrate-binding domain-containing protein [Lentisphaerota bacterium]
MNMSGLLEFRVMPSGNAADQIAQHVRELVERAQLQPEAALPPTAVLAARWHTSVASVQHAMTRLVEEGVVRRTPRRGTFVRKREARRQQVAVYYPEDVLAPSGYGYIPALHGHIRETLAREGIDAEVWMDPRPASGQDEAWPALTKVATARRLQGIILPYTDWGHIAWVSKLGVPAAFCSSARLPQAVAHDASAFFTFAVDALARQGCRRVGLICLSDPGEPMPDGTRSEWGQAMDTCIASCARLGLGWRADWVRHPASGQFAHQPRADAVAAQTRYGYEAFHALWRRRARPDGLIVANDVAATGVIAAMLERGVRGGRDLRVVLHRNRGVSLFCPMPATFVDYDTAALAEALVGQLQRQWRGEPVSKVYIAPERREA